MTAVVARPQRIDRMRHPHIGLLFAEIAGDLQQAADVAGEDGLCSRVENVLSFAAAELFGHFRLRQVIAAGRAAAILALRQGHQLQTGDHLE